MFEMRLVRLLREVAGAATGGRVVSFSVFRRAAVLRAGARLGVAEGASCDLFRAVPDGLRGVIGEGAEVGLAGLGDV